MPDDTTIRLDDWVLGETDSLWKLDGAQDMQTATEWLLASARRSVCILTPDFEPERFNTPEFASQLSAFARRSRYSEAFILLADPALAVRWGHHVVTLMQRIPDLIAIRQLHEDDMKAAESWMLADDIGLLRRHSPDGLTGILNPKAIPHAQDCRRRFTEWWERARDVRDFRRMHL